MKKENDYKGDEKKKGLLGNLKILFSDLFDAIELYLSVETKDGDVVKFFLNNKQRQLRKDILHEIRRFRDEGHPVRIMILKGRQFGFSTLLIAFLFIKCLFVPNTRAVVIAHTDDATKKLFRKVKFFTSSMKMRPTLDRESEKQYTFPLTNSWFYMGTAGTKSFGRGDNITDLHCSEVPQWDKAPTVMNGLIQAVAKSGRVYLECTANGRGGKGAYFFKLWSKNWQVPGASWKGLFYSWIDFIEYEMNVPEDFKATDEERQIYKTYLKPAGISTSIAKRKLMWRRWKINETETEKGITPEQIFRQEYPFTPEEAFITSGNCIFNVDKLLEYKTKKGEVEGNLTIFMKSTTSKTYMGIDVAEGITLEDPETLDDERKEELRNTRDSHAVEIFDGNLNQIAEYVSQEDHDQLAENVVLLAERYNSYIIPEANNVGVSFIKELKKELRRKKLGLHMVYHRVVQDENYQTKSKKIGWATGEKSKNILLGSLVSYVRRHDIQLFSSPLINECLATTRDDTGKTPTHGKDRLMAVGFALQGFITRPPSKSKVSPEKKRSEDAQKKWKAKRVKRAKMRKMINKQGYKII